MAKEAEAPRYELTVAFFVDDALHEEGTIIEFDGEPNEGMIPLNPAAKDKMAAFNAKCYDRTPLDEQVYRAMVNRPRIANEDKERSGVYVAPPKRDTTHPVGVPTTGFNTETGKMTAKKPKTASALGQAEAPKGAPKPKRIFAAGVVEVETPQGLSV